MLQEPLHKGLDTALVEKIFSRLGKLTKGASTCDEFHDEFHVEFYDETSLAMAKCEVS